MAHRTSIDLASDTRDDLRGAKRGNETYDDVVNRLLKRNLDTQAVRNALDDLETTARMLDEADVDSEYSDMIRETVAELRDESGADENE